MPQFYNFRQNFTNKAQILNKDEWTELQTKQIVANEFPEDVENSNKIILVSKDFPAPTFKVIMLNSDLDRVLSEFSGSQSAIY